MGELKNKKMPFAGVAIALILFGAAVFAIAIVSWKLSFFFNIASFINCPFEKVIGGALILAMGYIILELELIRDKK